MKPTGRHFTGSKHHQFFLMTFIALTVVHIPGTVLGWYRSDDMKGLWPVALSISVAISALYAKAFSLVAGKWGDMNRRNVWLYDIALCSAILLQYAVYYRVLTLGWIDPMIRSDLSFWLVYVFFLLAAVLSVFFNHANACLKKTKKES